MADLISLINVYNIRTGRKDTPVEAQVFGQVAVHRTVNGGPSRWVVTHIGAGGIIVEVRKKSVAIAVAKDFAKLDWSKVKNLKSTKALAALAPLRRTILKKHGVAV